MAEWILILLAFICGTIAGLLMGVRTARRQFDRHVRMLHVFHRNLAANADRADNSPR